MSKDKNFCDIIYHFGTFHQKAIVDAVVKYFDDPAQLEEKFKGWVQEAPSKQKMIHFLRRAALFLIQMCREDPDVLSLPQEEEEGGKRKGKEEGEDASGSLAERKEATSAARAQRAHQLLLCDLQFLKDSDTFKRVKWYDLQFSLPDVLQRRQAGSWSKSKSEPPGDSKRAGEKKSKKKAVDAGPAAAPEKKKKKKNATPKAQKEEEEEEEQDEPGRKQTKSKSKPKPKPAASAARKKRRRAPYTPKRPRSKPKRESESADEGQDESTPLHSSLPPDLQQSFESFRHSVQRRKNVRDPFFWINFVMPFFTTLFQTGQLKSFRELQTQMRLFAASLDQAHVVEPLLQHLALSRAGPVASKALSGQGAEGAKAPGLSAAAKRPKRSSPSLQEGPA